MCSLLAAEVSVIVQRVVMPVTGAVSWTVLDDDGVPVVPAEEYLAYLAALERSPNTVRAYALSLKLWFEFLGAVGVDWAAAGVEDVARFVSWLRAPAENVIVLDKGTARRSAATVNRYLAGVFGFYDRPGWGGSGGRPGGVAPGGSGLLQAAAAPRHQGASDPDAPGEAGGRPPGASHPRRHRGGGGAGGLRTGP